MSYRPAPQILPATINRIAVRLAMNKTQQFGIGDRLTLRVRDEFFPKALVNPDAIAGLDTLAPEAVNLKFIPAPLSKEQVAELIQIPPRK